MKRITRLSSAILVFFLLFSFISCTNILASDSDSESNNQNQTNGKVTLKGTINVSALEGAMPSACINSSTGSSENGEERSASFSTLPTGYQYFAKATKRGTTTVVGTAADECVWMGSDSDKSFAMNLDYGTWDVVAGLCVAGSAPNPAPEQIIYISPEREINLPVGAPLIYTASFSARPRMTDDGTGTIKLTMTKPSSSTCNLKFASCKLLMGDASAWATAFASGESVTRMSVAGNTIKLGEGVSIKSGAYTVQLKFYDCLDGDYAPGTDGKEAADVLNNDKGILVYSTIQTINVFDNLETDYWTRTVNDDNSPVHASNGTFNLTEEIVKNFSRTHIYVSSAANGGSDSNSGTAYQPFATLNKAISYIDTQGNTSTKKPFTITVNGNVSSSAVISNITAAHASSITIEGKTGSSSDVLNGGGTNRVLEISSTVPVTLSKIKVTAGKASTGGGGIRVAGSDSSNKAKLYIQSGTLITGNQLSSNANGIGLYAEYADVEMNGGEISGNSNNTSTEIHGAVGLSHAKFTLNDGEITGNSVKHLGANLHVNNSSELYIKGGKITNGTITRTGGDANAAGIWVDGNSSVEMTAGEISGNRVTVTGEGYKASGAAIYIAGNCSFKMSGGKIENNAVSAPIVRGGAIYFGNGATFELSSSAVIPYGAKNASNVIEKAVGKNDIFLQKNSSDDTKTTIKITSSTLSGIDSDGKVAAITMSDCKRGSRFLSAANETYLNNNKNKFILTHNTTDDKGWERWNNTSDTIKYVTINSPVYVASVDSGTTDSTRKWCPDTASLNDAERNGLCTKPFKSLNDAIAYISDSTKDAYAGSGKPAEIIIDGTITGTQQEIADTFTSAMAASLTIKGYKAPSATSSAATIKRYSSTPGSAQSTGTALKINTTVPVTIEDLTITGGKSNVAGGGIYLKQSGTLKLGNGVKITGNSTTNKGGGVYVDVGAKLFMYGTSLIGDSTTSTVLATDAAGGGGSANTAIMGGGIYSNQGEVYIGYDGLTGSPATPHKCDMLNGYGIRRNYVSGEDYSVGAGLCSIQGSVYISSGTISYNQSTISGGGIYSDGDSSNPAKIIIEAPVSSDNEFTMYGNKSVVGGAIHNSSYTTLTMSAGKIGGNPSNQQNTATNLGGAIYQGSKFTVSGSALIYPGSATSSLKTNDVYLPAGNFYVTAGSIGTSGNTSSLKMSLSPQEYKRGKKLVQADGVTVDATLWNKFALTSDDAGWNKGKTTVSSIDYVYITSPIYVASSTASDTTRVVCSAAPTSGNTGTKTKPYATIAAALADTDLAYVSNTITIDGTLSAQLIASTTSVSSGVTAVTLQGYKAAGATTGVAAINGGATASALSIGKNLTYTIKDLQITNGKADSGGGIYLSDGTVNLDSGAKVYGNNAKDHGAGVYVASGTTLNIKSSSEIYSNSLSGGSNMQGGGVYNNNGNVNIYSGSKIYKNSVSDGSGGAIYNAGTLTMSGGTIGGSSATDANTAKWGGGIYNDEEKSLTISGGELSYNSATSATLSASVFGGAIANYGTLTISGSATISNNTASQTNSSKGTAYGGGIYNSGSIEITGAITMDGNSASVSATTSGSSTSRGGAIYNQTGGILTMTKGSIGTTSANTVTGKSVSVMQGGAIYQGGTFNVSGSAKVYNASQAETKNDVYLANEKVVTINSNYTGTGNNGTDKMALTPANWKRGSYVLGGASCNITNAGYFKITDSEYSVLTDSTHKGKIDTGSTIYVSEAKISTATGYNTGSDTTGRGTQKYPFATIQAAALETWKEQAYTISVNGTLTAAGTGTGVGSGNLQNIPNNTSVKATSITLSGTNSAKIDANSKGSAFKINKAVPVTIKNITITGGSATNGGGIYVSAASASLTLGQGAKVSANTVTGNGGGIYIAGTSGTGKTANLIMNSSATVSGNSATGTSSYGGGVYLYYANLCMSGNALIGDTSGTSAATSGSTGHSNMAKNGGGIYCDTGSKVYLGYSSTSDSGTDLSASYGIRHNYASSCGGGIFVNAGTVNFKTGAISCNGTTFSTDCDGGGIWQNSGTTVTISGGIIAKNSAYYGGGVYAGGTFSMSGGTIGDSSTSISAPAKDTSGYYSNYAAYGGGIYAPTGASVSLTGGYVSYNFATYNGGGIMAIPAFSFSATANYNGASSSGGGIKCANVTISGGTIKGNKAVYYGGGIHSTGIITMSGGAITENVVGSSGDGGAVYLNGSSAVINFEGSAKIVAGANARNNTVYLTNSAKVGVNGSNLPTSSTIATIVPYPYSDTNQVMGIDSAAVCAPQFNVWNNSYTWSISPTTGKLQYTNVLSNTSMANYSVSSGTKYNFVIPADVEQGNLEKFLDKLFNHNDTPTIGAGSSIDFSKVTSHIRLDSTIVGGGSDRRTNNITTFIVPGGSGDIYFHDSTYKPLMSVKEYIAPADSENYTSVDGVLYNKDMTELIKYPAAKTNTAFTIPDSVETVSSGAFYGAIYLQQITIPGSVKRLGECSFYNSGLVSVTIPGNEDILNAGYIFSNCEILSSVTINYGVKYIGTPYQAEVFKGCKNLKTVSIPNSVTRIGRAAFEDCFKNYSGPITVPSGVNHLGNSVFYGCTNLSLTFNCTTSGWKDYNGNTFSSANFTTNYFVNTGNLELTRN